MLLCCLTRAVIHLLHIHTLLLHRRKVLRVMGCLLQPECLEFKNSSTVAWWNRSAFLALALNFFLPNIFPLGFLFFFQVTSNRHFSLCAHTYACAFLPLVPMPPMNFIASTQKAEHCEIFHSWLLPKQFLSLKKISHTECSLLLNIPMQSGKGGSSSLMRQPV